MTGADLEEVSAIVDDLLRGVPARGRALVAIDGVGASGKSTFADALAHRIRGRPVLVLHVDDFFSPAEVRHARGRHSARDGLAADTVHELMRRYTGAQRLYFAAARPWERTSLVADNSEPGSPRVIYPSDSYEARSLR